MKTLPFNTPFIPYYDNSIENEAINANLLFNDDAIISNSPYNQDEEVFIEGINTSSNPGDRIKVCYEIGNTSEIEESTEIIIEDVMVSLEFIPEDDPFL